MYCEKCGSKMENGDLYCPNCGYRSSDNQTDNLYGSYNYSYNSYSGNVYGKNTSVKKIVLPAGIALGFIALVSLIIILIAGNSGYKKTVDNYFKAHENNNAGMLASSVIAQYWLDYSENGWGQDPLESAQEIIDRDLRDWGCGDDVKITYKISGERRANEEELRDLENNIYSWYAYYVRDRDEFSITDAYVLDIDFTVIGENGAEDFYYPDGFLVIKEDGKWRVPMGSLNNSFFSNQ